MTDDNLYSNDEDIEDPYADPYEADLVDEEDDGFEDFVLPDDDSDAPDDIVVEEDEA